jgi:carbon monoxide dehydrogenase subunit G
MLKIESRIGIIKESEERIYSLLSDFNNFKNLVPADRVKNWEATADNCSFTVEGIGPVGLRITEKEPNKLIKITSDGKKPIPFFIWIQIKEVAEKDSRIKIIADVDVNPLMAAMVKGPLKSFVDTLVEQAEKMKF